MKARRFLLVVQVLAALLLGILVIVAAWTRARENALTSFAAHRATWPDAQRAPVEHRAVEVLGHHLGNPDGDPELVRAAMGVMRQSGSWTAMAEQIQGRLRGVLDGYLGQSEDPRALTELIPNARLRLLPGGHGFFIEEAPRVNGALLEFLKGVKR